MTTFRFRGATNNRYLYSLMSISEALSAPLQAGILIFANGTSLVPFPVYIAAAKSLRAALLDLTLWKEATEQHGATLFYFRCDPQWDEESRGREATDLIEGYAPPMNTGVPDR